MRASVALLAAAFVAGGLCGALALRGWQKSKPYIMTPGPSRSDTRRQMLAASIRRPAIVMLGDSITEEAPWADLIGCDSVANFGISGDTSEGILARLDDVLRLKPGVVFLMVGTNDIAFRTSASETVDNVRLIVRRLESVDIAVVVQAVLPLNGAEREVANLNRLMGSAGLKPVSLPISTNDLRDGVHLKSAAYEKWRDAIAPLVAEYCH